MTTAPKRQPIPFGKYLLLDRINIGGMAEVWRAKTFGAGGFERLVAIKRILPNIAEDEEFITMFIDEAKITVQLNHANIAQIYELSHIANSYFIAMEYVSGKDMRAVFDRKRKQGEPAPIPLTCYCIARCCEGLDYAHRNKDRMGRDMNIVHRDVSPQNLLISYDGEVKVIDFGIAKAAGKATKTQAGILKGKFGYMSPEQIRGLPLDRRSDVFAIGVCLYEMLTGERLFVGDSDFSVLEKVRKVEVLPPSHFNRKIPEGLEKIVMKALAKDVDERYQYASEVADDLQRFLVTTENVFGRKDLASFMKATFAEDVEKEKSRLQEYNDIKPPEGMVVAAEMGFGVGALPGVGGVASSASAVTSLPTMVPPGAVPMISQVNPNTQTAAGLPPIVRPQPPTLAPIMTQGTGSLQQSRGPSLPRLTAVAPMLTNDNDQHQATMLVDGGFGGEPGTNPGAPANGQLNVRNRPPEPAQEVPTDPGARPRAGQGVVPRPGEMAGTQIEMQPQQRPPPFAYGDDGLPPNARRPPPPRPPPFFENASSSPTILQVPTSDTSPTLQPVANRPIHPPPHQQQPHEAVFPTIPTQPTDAPPSNGKLIAIVGAIALVTVMAVGGIVFFKPHPRGLLMIDIPAGLDGKAMVSINGKTLTEIDGSPLNFPLIREVPAGPATVMLKADGYEPLIETVSVKEGNEVTQLTHKLKKKGE